MRAPTAGSPPDRLTILSRQRLRTLRKTDRVQMIPVIPGPDCADVPSSSKHSSQLDQRDYATLAQLIKHGGRGPADSTFRYRRGPSSAVVFKELKALRDGDEVVLLMARSYSPLYTEPDFRSGLAETRLRRAIPPGRCRPLREA